MSERDHVSNISLRLRDAERDVGALLASWGLMVGRSWLAGTPRETPTGRPLGGVWPDSYAYARLALPAERSLTPCIRHVLGDMEPYSTPLAGFVESGGFSELYVYWHFTGNSGDSLDWRLLERLAAQRLALSLDVYPEPRTGDSDEEEGDDQA